MSLIEKLWKAHHDFLAGGPAIDASLIAALEASCSGVAADELRDRYREEEHPYYDRAEWVLAVSHGDTLLGYWEWVRSKLEEALGEV